MLSTVGNFPKKDAAWWAEGGVTKNAAKYTFSAVLHRYTRLTPMYFFILMVYIYIFPILGNGPTWNETNGDNTFCKDFWWTNILYISNLYPCQLWNHHSSNPKNDWGNDQCASGDGELGCYIQTWYLSNDFQMFIAAIPAALLFKWKIHAAYAYTAGLILVSLAYTAHLLDHFNGTMCDMIICGGGGHRRLQDDGGPAFCGTFPDAGPDASSPNWQSNGTPHLAQAKDAKPRKMHPVVLAVGWVVSIPSLYYCAFGPNWAMPTEDGSTVCGWAHDRASPNVMGLASLALNISVFCNFLYSILLFNAVLGIDFLGLALLWPQVCGWGGSFDNGSPGSNTTAPVAPTVRARPGRLCALAFPTVICLWRFVWARGALHSPKRRLPARAADALRARPALLGRLPGVVGAGDRVDCLGLDGRAGRHYRGISRLLILAAVQEPDLRGVPGAHHGDQLVVRLVQQEPRLHRLHRRLHLRRELHPCHGRRRRAVVPGGETVRQLLPADPDAPPQRLMPRWRKRKRVLKRPHVEPTIGTHLLLIVVPP
jgi:hypothetical protein